MAATVKQKNPTDLEGRPDQSTGSESFAAVYRRYKDTLTNYAYRRGASDPEAAANMALFDGYRAMARMEDRSDAALGAYLHRATLGYAAKDNYQRYPVPTELDDDVLIQSDPAEWSLDQAWLKELVRELPPDQREVIESRFFLGLSGQETGERLGKDANAVYQLQHRAIRRLRRAVFATVLVILVGAGLIAIRQSTTGSSEIDNSPVDRSAEERQTVDGLPTTSLPDPTERENGAVELPRPNPDSRSGQNARIVTDDSGPDQTQSPSTTAAAQPGPLPAEPDSATTVADPVATTTVPVPTTVDQPEPQAPAAPVAAATPLTDCAPQQINATMSNFKLFNTASNSGNAADFVKPAAVRFLAADGGVLHTVDTSGPMRTGSTANSHGWIGAADGSGTYAVFDEAPARRYWGVLVNSADVSGWRSLQTLDPATNTWSELQACSR